MMSAADSGDQRKAALFHTVESAALSLMRKGAFDKALLLLEPAAKAFPSEASPWSI